MTRDDAVPGGALQAPPPMAPPPPPPHATRSTHYAADADAVESRMREQYGSYRLTDSRASMRDDIIGTSDFFINQCSIAGQADIDALSDYLTIGISTGRYEWSGGGEHGDATAGPFLVRPHVRLRALVSHAEVSCVSFDPAALERTARVMFADDRLRPVFDSSDPVSTTGSGLLAKTLMFTVANRELVLESPLAAAGYYRHLAATVLEWFPLRGGEPADRRATVEALSSGYRRAMSFIDDNVSLPISIDDIAEAAGLPARQLDAAFRWHSPTRGTAADALRRVRLSAAHHDLVDADPTRGDTVGGVARRWGFDPRSFARHYTAAFGDTPRHVLAR